MYSVIVPVYNEEKSLSDTISRIKLVMKGYDHEIICINDCSTDNSKEILSNTEGIILINNNSNKGYGGSLKKGFKIAKGDFFIITDADGTYPIEDIPNLIKHTDKYDMVIGSRTGKNVHVPFSKKVAKEFLKLFARIITGQKIPDLNSGLRVFKRELAEEFYNLFPDGFSLTTTITISSILSGYDVKFIPINYYKRKGKSSIKARDFFKFIFLITRLAIFFKPLKIFLLPGLTLMLVGIIIAIFQIMNSWNIGSSPLVFFLSGIQICIMAFLAELIIKMK
ncbi:glycosyltransferase family 2 protein [Candidatus Woesearchaeota archaeon]|nr:glycosyltransferase family 2 protein [Candidatus Woesearchaeota archaeon]